MGTKQLKGMTRSAIAAWRAQERERLAAVNHRNKVFRMIRRYYFSLHVTQDEFMELMGVADDTEGRALAYRIVRRGNPRLEEVTNEFVRNFCRVLNMVHRGAGMAEQFRAELRGLLGDQVLTETA